MTRYLLTLALVITGIALAQAELPTRVILSDEGKATLKENTEKEDEKVDKTLQDAVTKLAAQKAQRSEDVQRAENGFERQKEAENVEKKQQWQAADNEKDKFSEKNKNIREQRQAETDVRQQNFREDNANFFTFVLQNARKEMLDSSARARESHEKFIEPSSGGGLGWLLEQAALYQKSQKKNQKNEGTPQDVQRAPVPSETPQEQPEPSTSFIVEQEAIAHTSGTQAASCGPPETNGCGPKGILGWFVPDLFFGAQCVIHDLCYAGYNKYASWTREQCDEQLANDAALVGGNAGERFGGRVGRNIGEAIGSLYGKATGLFGKNFFDKAREEERIRQEKCK